MRELEMRVRRATGDVFASCWIFGMGGKSGVVGGWWGGFTAEWIKEIQHIE